MPDLTTVTLPEPVRTTGRERSVTYHWTAPAFADQAVPGILGVDDEGTPGVQLFVSHYKGIGYVATAYAFRATDYGVAFSPFDGSRVALVRAARYSAKDLAAFAAQVAAGFPANLDPNSKPAAALTHLFGKPAADEAAA